MLPLLDRALAIFAPELVLNRTKARAQLALLGGAVRAYDGAQRNVRTSRWRAPAKGAVLEVQAGRAMLRDRARDLVRNNPWGRRAKHIVVSNQVGCGIVPRAKSGISEQLDTRINQAWHDWVARCSPSTGLDFYGIQALAAGARFESGESLIRMAPSNPFPGVAPLALQVLETDWMVEDHSAAVMPQSPTSEGIKFGEDGRRISYQLYKFNPNDYWQAGRNDWEEVDAKWILHHYRVERPGQLRGVSDLASVMLRMRDLDEYHDAALMMAKVQAVLGVFVTQQGGPASSPMGTPSSDDIGRLEELTPGMVGYLRPGEDVKFLAPGAAGPFAEYTRTALRAIAMGAGVTYYQLTGDLSEANYSSLRAGTIEFRRQLEQDQWLMLVPQICQPVWDMFIQQAVLAGILPTAAAGCRCEWAPPRFEMVDPNRDTLALIAQVRAGFKTMKQAIAEMGWDPVSQVAEIAAFNKMVDQAEVILDTDPRRISSAGILNPPADLPNAPTSKGTE